MAKMSEYRCVNYYELCRLCTGSHGTKVHIFSEDGKKRNLFSKITGCLPIQLSEKDKLPKIVCGQCLQQVESIMEFRETCQNAQAMLESCLNSSKLRNEGKVYIKDVVAKRNVLPTTPALVTVRQASVPNSVKTVSAIPASNVTQISTQNSDFLSSIIQAVGIPSVEEGALEQATTQLTPQYTLTLDGQTLKANPIQYKIKEDPPTATLVTTEQQQQQQSAFAQVDEFLKLKTTTQIGSTQITRRTVKAAVKPPEPPKAKKPKINLVLATPTASQQQAKVVTTPSITTTPMAVSTSPTKTVQLQDLKIFSPTNKCFLPITLKDGSSDQQILTQIDTKNIVLPTAFLQMKLQPQLTTVDGQPVVQLTPAAIPTSLSISSAPQTAQIQTAQTSTVSSSLAEAVQNAEIIFTTSSAQFQQQTQQQVQPVSQASTVRITPLSSPVSSSPAVQKAPPPATITIQTSPPKPQMAKVTQQQVQQQQQQQPRRITITKKVTQTPTTQVQIKTEPGKVATSAAVVTTASATTTTATTTTSIRTANIPPNCTTCDTCGKTFKRKEHLIQHLKLHAGLRPFKCEEVGCNKTFSRKEHLMRHVVSHTGKKMFSCEFCHKFFSRKDNLNKHKRTHSEYVNNGPFYCEICQKSFVVKMYYVQHKAMHEKDGTAGSVDDSKEADDGTQASNGAGESGVEAEDVGQSGGEQDDQGAEEQSVEDSTMVVSTTPSSQAQIMQVHFTPVTSGQGSGGGGSGMGSHDTTVLTLPSNISNFVTLNSTQFVASSDVMQHFKIENN
ncbi:early growth response protein 1-like isoform X3 [Phlebotomus papatasi]|uniref:early growth response protein 1-like isoform X3 n=1 Tax=Phlebotomus papatasi TaxID=29031 RepID=UPI0024844F8D|nr:early growth response protein 1-like isoform X3 [Phlebotomus papatasi]